jgi:RNA polymerase sigma factor for flagellar operon FliA
MTDEERDQVILEHLPKVQAVVHKIAHRLPSHIDIEDLVNTGVLGLMDAIEKYDSTRETKFRTYAEYRITGAILDQLRSLDWVPRSVRQKGRRMENASRQIEGREARAATQDEMAEILNVGIDEFHRLRRETEVASQVNMDVFAPTLGSQVNESRDIEKRDFYEKAIAKLDAQERAVIRAYFYHDKDMKAIAKTLGVTVGRVSQIRTLALAKLRKSRF